MFTTLEIRILKGYLLGEIDKRRRTLYKQVKQLNNAQFDKIVAEIKECSTLIEIIEG